MSNPTSGVTSGRAWAEFWGGEHSIYVNERHVAVHYARIARDLRDLIAARANAHGAPRVLDWGCGDAFGAADIASACRELWLFDGVEAVRARVAQRFAGRTDIRVLDAREWDTLGAGAIDMIVVVSVAQYLSRADLEALLGKFKSVLRADGEVVFADVIPHHVSMAADIASLLSSAWNNGFFVAACVGLVRTFFSEYRRLRARAGFSTYDEREFGDILRSCGFSVERLDHNVGFNQQRMTFRARPLS